MAGARKTATAYRAKKNVMACGIAGNSGEMKEAAVGVSRC